MGYSDLGVDLGRLAQATLRRTMETMATEYLDYHDIVGIRLYHGTKPIGDAKCIDADFCRM